MEKIKATEAYFIKLGARGAWEAECMREGTIRFGYRGTPHELCLNGEWDAVRDVQLKDRHKNSGTATNDTRQIRTFYEANEDVIFITFVGGLLHWCRPKGPAELLADQERQRGTIDGWHSTSIGGTQLTTDRLSGNLLKVQRFQGTICRVKAFEYLMRKLNDELSPQVAAAEEAEQAMIHAIIGLMRLLTWRDFELLVDLVFSTSGWRRIGVVGRTQKAVDLELLLSTTGERAFVQIKAQANNARFSECAAQFNAADIYDRMFFVWHSGDVTSNGDADGVTLVGPARLAQMVLDAGLSSWLREKVM